MGQNGYGTIYNGTGSALPIDMVDSQVLRLSTFAPSFNMSILNTLSSASFTSRPDTSFTEVSATSLVSVASSGNWNTVLSAYNVFHVDVSPGATINKAWNTFNGAADILCTCNSFTNSSFSHQTCGINDVHSAGCGEICYGYDDQYWRNNFYGVTRWDSGGSAGEYCNNLNSHVTTPLKNIVSQHMTNSYAHTFGLSGTNSFNNRVQSVDSFADDHSYSAGCRSYGRWNGLTVGLDGTINSAVESENGPFASKDFTNSALYGRGAPISAVNSSAMAVEDTDCIINFHCSTVMFNNIDTCNFHHSLFLCTPAGDNTWNSTKETSISLTDNCNDAVMQHCFFVTPTAFSCLPNMWY